MIPSPSISSVSLGPLTVHFYAISILAGIGLALWWATKRWERRGGSGDDLFDIVFVAIIAGIVGSRIWHVLTSPEPFFGAGGDPMAVFYIWQGGLAIYGGVAGGALAVWIMARVKKVSFIALADTIGPTIMAAQILGRFGNWFNQELYGPALDTWWAWKVTCVTNGQTIGGCIPGTYHPTFLYEQLWNLAGLAGLLLLSRRFAWGGGRIFWAYVAIYSTGRAWIDAIRSEPVLMVGPLRIHTLVAIVMALVGIGVFVYLSHRKRQRGGEVVAADGSFELFAQTAGNGPDEDEVEKSGTPPSTGEDPSPGP
ncbi:prolipoprotein diacylglyceryl transferase [Brachybacterium sp. FME24]|uniref:prolipoprotein diacylglyceryl transferase n=1 Tax=Brachybacterium sp. FME24 TaxID=2742605 RepID=UPI001866B26A|nr:prolipoprotein diacylglyceryl transferase [Brachybacterium sp. FME24]